MHLELGVLPGIVLQFSGSGVDEIRVDKATGKALVSVDKRYFRPAEVEQLCGNPEKARVNLGWKPQVNLKELVNMMVDTDLDEAGRDKHLLSGGFQVNAAHE